MQIRLRVFGKHEGRFTVLQQRGLLHGSPGPAASAFATPAAGSCRYSGVAAAAACVAAAGRPESYARVCTAPDGAP